MTASSPTLAGLATQPEPLRDKVPLDIEAEICVEAMPGTEMLSGFSMPAYMTFIMVFETVAVGSLTK
jgi:esterase/lipase superfamily enzyme